MRLLLVEDEVDIQSFLRRSLEESGYQVEVAQPDGKTAERLAVDGSFDVLIVDLGLPDQDGITLILRLRQLGVSAPVLILSARRSVDDRVRGLEQGGDDYLTKPFALAELLARLRNLLSEQLLLERCDANTRLRPRIGPLEARGFTRRQRRRTNPAAGICSSGVFVQERRARGDALMILDKVWGMRIQQQYRNRAQGMT